MSAENSAGSARETAAIAAFCDLRAKLRFLLPVRICNEFVVSSNGFKGTDKLRKLAGEFVCEDPPYGQRGIPIEARRSDSSTLQ